MTSPTYPGGIDPERQFGGRRGESGVWRLVLCLGMAYSLGFFLLGLAIRDARRSTRPKSWPTTPGIIRELALRRVPPPRTIRGGPTYRVDVRYAYSVKGRNYEGTRLAFGYVASSGYPGHQEIYQKLRTSRTISVRYDPADPGSSCLSYGVHRSIRLTFAFSVFFLGFTTVFACVFWVYTRPDRVLVDNLLLTN